MPIQAYFNVAAELIALISGTYFFRQIRSGYLYLYVFVIIGFTTEIILLSLGLSGLKNTQWLSHIYFPLEFLVLSLLYLKNIKNIIAKKWMKVVIAGLMLFSVINPIFLQKLTFYSQVRSFSSIVLVVFSLLYFYQVISDTEISKLSREPMIWVNIAVLMYYSIGLFYNVLFTHILEYSREFLKFTIVYFAALNTLLYLLITLAFVMEGWPKIRKKDRVN